MNANNNSNIVIFLSGHGGDEFFKFRDREELSSDELAVAVSEMYQKNRFNNIVMIADTCQGATLFDKIDVPGNVISISSSQKGENSFSYLPNEYLGATTIDRFSYKMAEFLKTKIRSPSDLKKYSFNDILKSMDPKFLQSHPSISISSVNKSISNLPLATFFGVPNKKLDLTSILQGDKYYQEFENSDVNLSEYEYDYDECSIPIATRDLCFQSSHSGSFIDSQQKVELIQNAVKLVFYSVSDSILAAIQMYKLNTFHLLFALFLLVGLLKDFF